MASEEGEADNDTEDEPTEPKRRAPDLYHEDEVPKLSLKFHVGDTISCSTNGGWTEGTVIQRFYREEEWPAGRYAAVRALELEEYLYACLSIDDSFVACSTKFGCCCPDHRMVPSSSMPRVTTIATSGKRIVKETPPEIPP